MIQQMVCFWINQMLQDQKHNEQNHLRPAKIQDLFIFGIQVQDQIGQQMHNEQQHILLPERCPLFFSRFSHQLESNQCI